ncbi:uncharacterized protein LOC141623654 isoform X2 [Silene latifolia]|uniref:uncharacterized protein LOC141623654 isoform X2 n=1 Tax=Silene latifolia TaxID=37657 RepID=UPI003D7853C2
MPFVTDSQRSRMKPKTAYLDELTAKSKDYKVKVRVLEKRRPKTSPDKKVLYQSLLLQDDKGTKMRGALFADQVEIFEDAIKRNRVYEITNAPISPVKPEWKTNPTDLDYQMTFGRRTIVLPVDNGDDGNYPTIQDYRPISQLPRVPNYAEMFDVVGVVLFVEDQPRMITTNTNCESKVREVVLIDHSTSQPLSISVWDELGEDDQQRCLFQRLVGSKVGLTTLRVSNHRAFSMSTSLSTIIIHSPVGAKAEALASWMTGHHMALTELRSRSKLALLRRS